MLHESGLGEEFWAEAVAAAFHGVNKSPCSALEYKTPEEVWTKTKPDLSGLRIFGCRCYTHIPRVQRSKIQPTTTSCIFIGYPPDQRGYRVWNAKIRKAFVARDIVFDEILFPARKNLFEVPMIESRKPPEIGQMSDALDVPGNSVEIAQDEISEGVLDGSMEVDPSSGDERADPKFQEELNEYNRIFTESLRRPVRTKKRPVHLDYYITMYVVQRSDQPEDYVSAMTSPDAKSWKNATDQEMEQIYKNCTWTLVEPPPSCNILATRWVFRRKGPNLFRARLVVKVQAG